MAANSGSSWSDIVGFFGAAGERKMTGTLSSFGNGGFFVPSLPLASFAQCPRPGTGTDSLRHVCPEQRRTRHTLRPPATAVAPKPLDTVLRDHISPTRFPPAPDSHTLQFSAAVCRGPARLRLKFGLASK